MVGGDIGKLHHILLLRIKSAGKTIFLYKVHVCDKIETDVTCLTKISTNGDSQPDSMLFSPADQNLKIKQWLKLKMISWQLKLKMPWQACKIIVNGVTRRN